jgi:hypothetical protein
LATQRDPDVADVEELALSDYESGSPPSRGERTGVGDDSKSSPPFPHHRKHSLLWNLPDLHPTININFTGNKVGDCDASDQVRDIHTSGFDFASRFQNLYDEHRKTLESDMDEDNNWSPSVKHSQSNKPTSHLQNNVSLPAKQAVEALFCESCQCKDSVDICGITQHQRFQGGESLCDTEHCKRGALGSKCCDNVARQALDSVVSGYSAFSSNRYPRKWTDTDFCEPVSGVDSISFTAGHTSPVYAGSTVSWAAEAEGKLPHTLCHSSPPVRESCGERGLTVGSTQQQTPPIWCLDCHENLIAVGCANGRLEFWEGSTGTFKVIDHSTDSPYLFPLTSVF